MSACDPHVVLFFHMQTPSDPDLISLLTIRIAATGFRSAAPPRIGKVRTMTWLVTGGAGYIGSHVVRAFGAVGLGCVVLDDLSSGHAQFVPPNVPLVRGSILDTDLVADTIVQHGVVGVVHLAGFKYAGVSVDRPLHTYEQNVTGTAHLLAAMAA